MACSTASSGAVDRGDAGYATAAFSVMALGLSMIAAAVMVRASVELRAARTELADFRRDAVLDSGLTLAADAVMREPDKAPLSWTLTVEGEPLRVAAEPEGGKLHVAAANAEAEALIAALTEGKPVTPGTVDTAGDLAQARARLAHLSETPAWRSCAASLFSPLSRGDHLAMTAPRAPVGEAVNWRAGEVWRVVVVDSAGRGADSLVRFTGRPEEPIALLDRRTGRMDVPDMARCLAYAAPRAGS